MGQKGSKQNKEKKARIEQTLKEEQQVDTSNFKISNQELIFEKYGRIQQEYTLMNVPLGKGSYGEVRKGVHKKTGQQRAVKIIDKSQCKPEEQKQLIEEFNILKQLDHPNIIKVYEVFQDNKFLYIVTELCTGGELFDRIIEYKHFNEKEAADVMYQILNAINYLHKNKIVHRDLKPENLLLDSKNKDSILKLVDFGTSTVFDPSLKMSQKLGTPYYIAPEVLRHKYNEKCDVWSCGVIMYILLCGYPPFNAARDEDIMKKVEKGVFTFPKDDWKDITIEAQQMICKMLTMDPQKRYSAEEALQDPWIKKFRQQQQVDMPNLIRSLNNMKTFRAGKKLQEAVWMFIVNYLATKEEKNELLKTFQSLDTNGDGKLSREELINGYSKILTMENAIKEVDKIMKVIDKNDNGDIDYSEWVAATISREQLLSVQRLEMAFNIFDKDGSGSLQLSEFKEIFGGAGVSEDVWKAVIKEVDKNGDGEISYQEFKEMMLKYIKDEE
ncbi:calcium-dependent kinase (macronuclear) [Tetrahymena thermophila SB210]|uniref:Calcium-dependent protein kinase 1 n=1 Tax=Tetrahymena thermophila (strain SB210) TaxID=312017 RepID=I7LWJ8_TETTS|nr:calcium-dependent kinase [Tetrahymena thermophila SB210]EAS02022.1 calcium-dependent kinase [Tetrahymena thermophila SB210]|eukprot:XP_001022267.1 calcium-dependent kinase [Tetrahymena thermophila SB210]